MMKKREEDKDKRNILKKQVETLTVKLEQETNEKNKKIEGNSQLCKTLLRNSSSNSAGSTTSNKAKRSQR
eukprot:1486131-Amphidinium_carterae.1